MFDPISKEEPGYAEACNNLGKTYTDQGKLDDALTYYRRALDLKPDQAVMHSNLAYSFQQFRLTVQRGTEMKIAIVAGLAAKRDVYI